MFYVFGDWDVFGNFHFKKGLPFPLNVWIFCKHEEAAKRAQIFPFLFLGNGFLGIEE